MTEIEVIWAEFHDKLLSFIKRRVSDRVVAEDIRQEIFLKIHARIETLGDQRKLESWVYRITRNTIVDYYRTRKTEEELPDWLEATQIDAEEEVRRELSACLAAMVNYLPDKYRTAVQLSELEGKTRKEVARQENISLSGAKSRVQRGRGMLRKMLQDCCRIDIDRRNQITDFSPNEEGCKSC